MSNRLGMLNRREVLRIGALSVLAAPQIVRGGSERQPVRRAKGCIFLLLQGGLSHLETWDPKPEAPTEIRGWYGPASTTVAGLNYTGIVPKTSQIAHLITTVRSMTHKFNNHIAGTYITLTGSIVQPNADREAAPDDFPGPGAMLNYLHRAEATIPTAVSLPNWLSIPGPSNRMPGQYAGFLGSTHDPFLIQGQPQQPDFRPLNLSLPGEVPQTRFESRTQLLSQMDEVLKQLETGDVKQRDKLYDTAFDLLLNPKFRDALDLSKEDAKVRERYGMTKIGQSLLLARRLIEAGVTLVGFNEFNQYWDTHSSIENTYRHKVPPLDQAYSALILDLQERGMLDETLVINTGEFGRTPLINKDAGRDHWPDAYSLLLAGGGIKKGGVIGRSDGRGTFVAQDPVAPADVLATMWSLMGIDPATTVYDRLNRPHALSSGQVLESLIG